MTSVTCKDCKHWGSPNEPAYISGRPVDWKTCSKIDMADFQSKFDNEERQYKAPDGVLAMTQDGSSYRADLWTAPDFFCYHGEAK